MSFLRRVAGLSLIDGERSKDIRERLRIEQLLLRVERSQLRWLGLLVRIPPGWLPGEVFQASRVSSHLGGDRGADQRHSGGIISLSSLGDVLVSPRRNWWKLPGRGTSGSPCSNCCAHERNLAENKKEKNNDLFRNFILL